MKKNHKLRVLSFVVGLILLFTLAGCAELLISSKNDTNQTNNITNNITNEITEKVVKYEEMTISDINDALVTAVERVEKAVIGVTLKKITEISSPIPNTGATSEDGYQLGSGVIYKYEEIRNGENVLTGYKYYVITNRHVVLSEEDGDYQLYAYLGYDDEEIEATLLGYDKKVDIACFTFEYNKFIQPVEVADSSTLKKGQLTIAVGNPYGYVYYGSATMGIISNTERYITSDTDDDGVNDFYCEYIQHDASINSGNSGGGLFTLDGKLVGINTLKLVDSSIDNMGFAIPSNTVMTIIGDYIEKNAEIVRPRLGITVIEVRELTPAIILKNNLKSIPEIYGAEKQYGLYVTAITASGTIDGSGIEIDDIILEIGDLKLTQMYLLSAKLNSLVGFQVGEKVTIKYYSRSSDTIKEVEVVLKK